MTREDGEMTARPQKSPDQGARMARPIRRPARALALVLTMSLGACAWVPDWANPVEWYDTVLGDNVPPPPQQPTPGRRRCRAPKSRFRA